MKKLFLVALAIGVVALAGCVRYEEIMTPVGQVAPGATEGTDGNGVQVVYGTYDEADLAEDVDWPYHNGDEMPLFLSVTGEITNIRPSMFEEDQVYVELGTAAHFVVNFQTALILDGQLEVGMTVTGYFDTMRPTVMIYPPQCHAVAMVSEGRGFAVLDRFDENLNSFSGMWLLNYSDAVEVYFQDGTLFEGDIFELANRKFLVLYDTVPFGGTNVIDPTRIYVLFEHAVAPILMLTPEDLEFDTDDGYIGIEVDHGGFQLSQEEIDQFWASMFDPETVEIFVDDEVIDAPTPFVDTEHGAVMLPVAAIAEAMGYNVIGEGADVVIGMGITFVVGQDEYFIGRMAPRPLGAPPQLVDGQLFVPMVFFQEILSGAAYIMDGNVRVVSSVE